MYSRLPKGMTNTLKKIIMNLPRNERLKRGVHSLSEPNLLSRFAKIYSFYDSDMKALLFKDWVKQELSFDGKESGNAIGHLQQDVSNLDPLTQMLYIDTRADLPDDLLMVGDKTSMANSIESRVPFLDYRLIELIESMPAHMKLRGFTGKYLHKKAMEKWVPREVVYRKKKGFANPVNQWLKGSMSSFVNDVLLSKDSAVQNYFDVSYIQKMVHLHDAGKESYLRHIYLLISFELWHRQFIDMTPVNLNSKA
jgi:asparagine synthase (glutamine-hydrolysing)